jgi:hypothetical protein
MGSEEQSDGADGWRRQTGERTVTRLTSARQQAVVRDAMRDDTTAAGVMVGRLEACKGTREGDDSSERR